MTVQRPYAVWVILLLAALLAILIFLLAPVMVESSTQAEMVPLVVSRTMYG